MIYNCHCFHGHFGYCGIQVSYLKVTFKTLSNITCAFSYPTKQYFCLPTGTRSFPIFIISVLRASSLLPLLCLPNIIPSLERNLAFLNCNPQNVHHRLENLLFSEAARESASFLDKTESYLKMRPGPFFSSKILYSGSGQ